MREVPEAGESSFPKLNEPLASFSHLEKLWARYASGVSSVQTVR